MMIDFLREIYAGKLDTARWAREWQQLHAECKTFQMSPFVHRMLRDTGQTDRVPAPLTDALKRDGEQVLFHNMLVKNETRQVLEALDEVGIPAIPLKGVLFAERYFGHFGARGTSDIDILVKPGDLERAADCIRAIGYTQEDAHHSLHYHAEFAKPIPAIGENMSVELHHNVIRKHTAAIRLDKLWLESVPLVWEGKTYAYCRELNFLHTFYVMCLHASKHMMLSLKNVMDVAHLLQRYGNRLDMRQLAAMAEQDRTRSKVEAALGSACLFFPELRDAVRPIRGKRIPLLDLELIRTEERGAKSMRYYAYILLYPLLTMDTWRYRARHVKYMLLPPRDRIERMIGEEAGRRDLPTLYWKLYSHRFRLWRSHRLRSADRRLD